MLRSPVGNSWRPSPKALLWLLPALVLVSSFPASPHTPSQAAESDERPNLLFIMSDDQRIGTLRGMENVRSNFPVMFRKAYVTTPLCCPARATFLTGRYAHRHKVRRNGDYPTFQAREQNSLAPWLQAQGYYTGLFGKYMNRYTENDAVPPGWDEFFALILPEYERDRYTAFRLREFESIEGVETRNEVVEYPNPAHPDAYSTTLYGDRAEDFLTRADALGKPWALFLWPNAPHSPFVPEERYEDADVGGWKRPPSFMEKDMRDKPRNVRKKAVNSRELHLQNRRGQIRLLMSLDDAVGGLFERLDELDMRDNTVGIYTSDNGFFWGEHRLTGKNLAYEESARVPFRMAVPGVGPKRIGSIVANIDVAPTFMELADDPVARRYDGRSLLPLITGEKQRIRKALLIESWRRGRYRALRTNKWKYVYWLRSGAQELYNLRRDPYELRNRLKAKDPSVRRKARRVAKRLHAKMMNIRARPPAPS